jgi:hypothetical protein
MCQVSLVGFGNFVRPVAYYGESGWGGPDLGGIEQLHLLARLLGRRVPLNELGQHLVYLRSGNPPFAPLGDFDNLVEQLPDSLSGQRGHIKERHIAEEGRLGNQGLLALAGGISVLLFDQVPLVH